MKAVCSNVTQINQQHVNSGYVEIPVDDIDKVVPSEDTVTVYYGTRNWLKCEKINFKSF